MSATSAPSRKACLILEFMKTVQRVPKSQGAWAKTAFWANSEAVKPKELAKVSMNEPQPDEQASFSSIRFRTPSSMNMAFMS